MIMDVVLIITLIALGTVTISSRRMIDRRDRVIDSLEKTIAQLKPYEDKISKLREEYQRISELNNESYDDGFEIGYATNLDEWYTEGYEHGLEDGLILGLGEDA